MSARRAVPSIGRRCLRGARVVLALVVAGTLLDIGPVRAQEEDEAPVATTLAGYSGSAAASGLHAYYNLVDVLPIPPPVDLGAPDALATISSGPSTFARAGVVDPGDLLANPDALLALFSSDYPAGTLPPFPYRVTASSGVGAPVAESNPAPGLNARVSAQPTSSSARASLPVADAPAIARVGTMVSTATTDLDGSTVTVHARSETAGIDVLGLVKIESLVTDVTATSDGTGVQLSGGTKVVGATLLGSPITIDADGIHQAPGSKPLLAGVLGSLTGPINEVLKTAGIHITLAGPVQQAGGGEGQLASTGLRVELDLNRGTFPALTSLLDSIPPLENPVPGAPSIEDLLVVAQARHLLAIEVGRGVVSLKATAIGPDGAVIEPTTPIDTGSGGFVDPGTSSGVDLPSTGLPVSTPTQPVGASGTPQIPAGAGVGALVLLALLATPFIGERLAWACAAVLAADRPERCAREER